MTLDDFVSKYKVTKFYAYKQEVDSKSPNIFYGWENVEQPVLSDKMVVSTASRSKRLTEEEVEWSKREGVSAASLNDYARFFRASLDMSPSDFVEKWRDKEAELELERKSLNPGYRDKEGVFLISLARLISEEKRFSLFGRVYKVVTTSNSDGNSHVSGYEEREDKA